MFFGTIGGHWFGRSVSGMWRTQWAGYKSNSRRIDPCSVWNSLWCATALAEAGQITLMLIMCVYSCWQWIVAGVASWCWRRLLCIVGPCLPVETVFPVTWGPGRAGGTSEGSPRGRKWHIGLKWLPIQCLPCSQNKLTQAVSALSQLVSVRLLHSTSVLLCGNINCAPQALTKCILSFRTNYCVFKDSLQWQGTWTKLSPSQMVLRYVLELTKSIQNETQI